MEGAGDGVRGGGPFSSAPKEVIRRPIPTQNRIFNHLPASPTSFCMTYDADEAAVARVVAATMKRVGNAVIVSNEADGVFETEYLERRHSAARWLDSYSVTVTADGRGRTVVRVLRTVYVSQDGRTFNQGNSVGHNEAWLLMQISNRVR